MFSLVGIRLEEILRVPCLLSKATKPGWYFGKDRIDLCHVYITCDTIKIPSCTNAVQHRPKFCSPSMTLVTCPCEQDFSCEVLNQETNIMDIQILQTIKKKNIDGFYYSCNVLIGLEKHLQLSRRFPFLSISLE